MPVAHMLQRCASQLAPIRRYTRSNDTEMTLIASLLQTDIDDANADSDNSDLDSTAGSLHDPSGDDRGAMGTTGETAKDIEIGDNILGFMKGSYMGKPSYVLTRTFQAGGFIFFLIYT